MKKITRRSRDTRFRAIERIVKGFANHRRIEMLQLIERIPDVSVGDIAKQLNIGYENASDHVRKLTLGGLVLKRNEGSIVRHSLTSRGKYILEFCKKLQ